MNNSKPEQTFPFDKNTLVVLTAKCPEGAAILKQSGSHWFAKPLPRQLQDDNLKEVFRGWLYLKSALSQHRFVHVINDRLFDVAFETKGDGSFHHHAIFSFKSHVKETAIDDMNKAGL